MTHDYADLEKRLRERAAEAVSYWQTSDLLREAADAIASLTRQLEEAREALAQIARISAHQEPDDPTRWETTHQRIARIAKTALGDGPWPQVLSSAAASREPGDME